MRAIVVVALLGSLAGCDQIKPGRVGGDETKPGAGGAPAATGPSEQNRKAYRVLCGQLCDAWADTRMKPAAQYDTAQIAFHAQSAILDLEALATDDPDLRRVRDEAKAATEEAVASLRRLDQLPRPPEAGELFLTGFVCGFVGRLDLVAEAGVRAGDRTAAIADEYRRLNSAYQRACTAKLLLKRAAPKYAGPTTIHGPLAVDLDEGFVVTTDDWLTATNTTGRTLTSALVVVELTGQNGDKKENIHYLPTWRAGATISAAYPDGIRAGDVVVGRQTVYLVQTVRVRVFADEGVVGDTTYQYAGYEKDRDIDREMDVLRPGVLGGFRNGAFSGKVFVLTNSTGRTLPNVSIVTTAGTRYYGNMPPGDSCEVGHVQVTRNLRAGDHVDVRINGRSAGTGWVTP